MKLKMKSAVITALLVSAVFIAVVSVFAGCKNTAQNPQNVPQAVTGVTLSKTTLSLTVGAKAPLTATVLPANAANKTVTWSSDKKAVADVDADGRVTAKKTGKAVITVTTADGSRTAKCTVTVNPIAVTGVRLNKTTLSLTIEEKESLTATVLPANAANKRVTWASDEPDIAEVDANGTVTAKKAGQAIITVTTEDGGKAAQCTVTVNPIAVTGVTLDISAFSLEKGSQTKLTAEVTPENAANKKVSWASDKPEIVSVDAEGNVTAKKFGTAKITVTTEDGGKTAQCTVTVNPIAVTGVSLDNTVLNLVKGSQTKLTATVTPENAANKKVSWASDKPEIVSVDAEGNVTAKKFGTALITVTAEDGNKTANCTVTVEEGAVITVVLSKTETGISIMAETEDGSPVIVEGCTEKSLESKWIDIWEDEITLHASKNATTDKRWHEETAEVVLKGKIIKLKIRTADGCIGIRGIDVSGLTSLEELYTPFHSGIRSINAQGCPKLKKLYSRMNNHLDKLDVSDCSSLEVLVCDHCGLNDRELNISGCTSLKILNLAHNYLSELNVQGFTYLEELNCHQNDLTSLNLSGLTHLQKLDCTPCGSLVGKIAFLDVSGCTSLKEIACYGNRLSKEVFLKLFEDLPYCASVGKCVLYTSSEAEKNNSGNEEEDDEVIHNYTDFTEAELKVIKDKNWKTYKLNNYKEEEI